VEEVAGKTLGAEIARKNNTEEEKRERMGDTFKKILQRGEGGAKKGLGVIRSQTKYSGTSRMLFLRKTTIVQWTTCGLKNHGQKDLGKKREKNQP